MSRKRSGQCCNNEVVHQNIHVDAPRDFLIFLFSPNEQRARGGRGGALPDFFSFFSVFPVQQTTKNGIGHRVK